MALIDFDKLAKQYEDDNDFGFSAVSEEEYNKKIDTSSNHAAADAAAQTSEQYKSRLQELEKIIIPFLTKLHQTGDKEYIYWPNRTPVIEKQIEKILKLTRD